MALVWWTGEMARLMGSIWIFGVAFAGSSREGGGLQELLEGRGQGQWVKRSACFHKLLHLKRKLEYTVAEVQCSVLASKRQGIAPHGRLAAILLVD